MNRRLSTSIIFAPFALLAAIALAAGLLIANAAFNSSPAHAGENGCYIITEGPSIAARENSLCVNAPSDEVQLRSFFSTQVFVEGGREPYTYRIVDGRLPNGVGINSQGVIAGRPTKAGEFCFTVKVSDRRGNTGSDSACIFVYRNNIG